MRRQLCRAGRRIRRLVLAGRSARVRRLGGRSPRGALHRGHRRGQTAAGRPHPGRFFAATGRRGGDQPAELLAGDHHQGPGAADFAPGESASRTGWLADHRRFEQRPRPTRAGGRRRSAATTARFPRPTHRPAGCTSWPTSRPGSGPAVLYRATPETFTDRSRWQGWAAAPGGGWNKTPEPLWPDKVGEVSMREVDGKPVLSYFNASTGNMEIRVAYDPTGLGAAPVTTVVQAGTFGQIPSRACRHPMTTGSHSRTAATSRRVRRSTRCGCSSVSGIPRPREPSAIPGAPVRREPVQARVGAVAAMSIRP